ncbi:Glycosyltransferase, GT2 family [Nostoc flagelliforme CCNUN1]|uniref:Glycosyltransferase, GT2 family n=1 Tax=Nostoc flagelliforme CCNUN1 TaxID=2038116 RepID=A0A2K8SY72_9NOSO|nr:hypothetical protein [Nostoc flagelliforme]AUB40396.1 Glycosyltransferase, GT2 family [Nostoc flagelliforme CCNUN1]
MKNINQLIEKYSLELNRGSLYLDCSQEKYLANYQNAVVIHNPISQTNLFILNDTLKNRYANLIFLKGHEINRSKFSLVILDELWNKLSPKGYLVLNEFVENRNLSIYGLKSLIYDFSAGTAELCYENRSENTYELVFRKPEQDEPRHAGKIDAWSFGVITQGKRKEFVEKLLDSIIEQKIPEFEIILVGDYIHQINDEYVDKVKIIPFSQQDDKGWITKKKNIIAQNAKYENLLVVHDRFILDKNFYSGMCRYGNSFSILTCKQEMYDGWRTPDWVSINNSHAWATPAFMEYEDYSPLVYCNGGLTIIKKTIALQHPWNEMLFWNQAEDVELTHRLFRHGYFLRLNPYSKAIVLHQNNVRNLYGGFEPFIQIAEVNPNQFIYADEPKGLAQNAYLSNSEPHKFYSLKTELIQAKSMITAMESSKFWKLRKAWVKLKQALGLKGTE